jgi:hypothetical protein
MEFSVGTLIYTDRNMYSVPSWADWRAGRSAVVHGAGGDLVRTEEGGRDAAVAWAKETPGGLIATSSTGW